MLLNLDELAASSRMDLEIASFLQAHPLPASDPNDPNAMRRALGFMEKNLLSKLPTTLPGYVEIYHKIGVRDGYESTLKIHRPEPAAFGPLVVLIHAGGFVGGSMDQMTPEARAIVQLYHATVVSVDYRLTPEHTFPTQQHDVWDSCKWIAEHASQEPLCADPTKGFIVSGASVGGSMAAALSRKFLDEPLAYPVTGQWLAAPSLMDDTCVPEKYRSHFVAREQSAHSPLLNKAQLVKLKEWNEWDSASDLRYVVNSTSDTSKAPRLHGQVTAMDPYRDDLLVYDEMLKEAGVETKTELYAGCPHLCWVALPDLEISKKIRIDTILGMGWLLGQTMSKEVIAGLLGLSYASQA